MAKKLKGSYRLWRKIIPLAIVAVTVVAISVWIFWTERHPEKERELRIFVQEQLQEWFPEKMELPDELIGFVPVGNSTDDRARPMAVLLHGLDEPGGIWDELVPALNKAGIAAIEFRYPNDQAVDHSTDLLAEHWTELSTQNPVVLIGHSMGGLVIRDFVSRWRHPVGSQPRIGGPPVCGVILIATPNQGSEWARLRVWLELREQFTDIVKRRFSLFAALRDGTGAAKIDLTPGSDFLVELNSRPWPRSVPVCMVGGLLAKQVPAAAENLVALTEELGATDLADRFEQWLAETGEELGDGVVPVSSLELEHAPPPILVEASHRGLLVRDSSTDDEPPAIRPVLDTLAARKDCLMGLEPAENNLSR